MSIQRRVLVWVVVVLTLASCPRSVRSQCPTDPLWAFQAGSQSPATPVVSDAGWGMGLSFFAAGDSLYAVWNETIPGPGGHQAGTQKWVWVAPGTTIQNFPVPVPLTTGGEFVFVTTLDGRLHKIDVGTGTSIWVDTRRCDNLFPTPGTVCGSPNHLVCAQDQIIASPTVQLFALSNAAFQSFVMNPGTVPHASNDDLVMVATRNQCGDETHNRVVAYWASNLFKQWAFNHNISNVTPAPFAMGYGSEAATLDYATNTVYVGTHQPIGGSQPTVWALNTLNGSRKWTFNAGSILNRPRVGNGVVYVASTNDSLYSLTLEPPFGGKRVWVVPLGSGGVTRNVWAEFRLPAQSNIILATGSDGRVHRVDDLGASSGVTWSTPAGSAFQGFPALLASFGKIYVGRDDGTITQLGLADGAMEIARASGYPLPTSDPALDIGLTPGVIDRLLVPTGGGSVRRYCVPWDITTGVEVEATGRSPFGIVPNPSRGTTRIDYEVMGSVEVELSVFDLAGRRLRTLVSARKSPGRYSVEWDGRDDRGRALDGGVYFCRLRMTGAGSQTVGASTRTIVLR